MEPLQYAFSDKPAEITPIPPLRKHPTDAGMDVCALQGGLILPFGYRVFRTGLHFNIPEGLVLQAWPKSRHHWLMGAGIIDSGYLGEVLIKVVNYSPLPVRVRAGQQIAQLVLIPVLTPALQQIPLEELLAAGSERGSTGGIAGQNQ